MYEKFYNLNQNPFSLAPDPEFICMTEQHREALSGLIYSVCTRPGLTLLVGEVGTGKTTLLYTLLNFLEKKQYRTALCCNPLLSSAEFYDYLLASLDVPCASSLKSQHLIALQDSLSRNLALGKPSVLIVDEAQKLSVELLEEIRLLTNIETPRQKLLQIIIAGQPELTAMFRRPGLRQLKQRINFFCRLEPLSRTELSEYMQHRLSRAGLPKQTLFSENVIDAIYAYTGGIPRLVNTVCDNALQTAFAIRSPHVTVSIVDEAARDLDLVPAEAEEQTHPPLTVRPPADDMFELSDSVTGRGSALASEFHDLDPDPEPEPQPVPVTAGDGRSGPDKVPLETYSARQKSLGFLAGLLDFWR